MLDDGGKCGWMLDNGGKCDWMLDDGGKCGWMLDNARFLPVINRAPPIAEGYEAHK